MTSGVLESFENAVWIRAGVETEQTGAASEVALEVVGWLSLVVEVTVDVPVGVDEAPDEVVCELVPWLLVDTVPLELDRALELGLCVIVVVLELAVAEVMVTRYAPREIATMRTAITTVSEAPIAFFLLIIRRPLVGDK
jgi:hypothetical protein